MEFIIRPYHIAWLVCLVPIIAAHGAYFIGLWQGVANECMPYFEGCTSISRAARNGDAIFLFRGLMMPTAAFLIVFWYLQCVWLKVLTQKPHNSIFVLGTIGAVFLVLYADFLGTEGEFYEFMRHYGITLYFAMTILAQMLSIRSLQKITGSLDSKVKRYLTIQFIMMALYWVLGIANVVIKATGVGWADQSENVIEWNFALLMSLYFGLAAMMWKRSGFGFQFRIKR
ncbi:hypothetical protein [Kangiella koreensis]|uniref:DUF998 domain-containing protein n=1 Tax=Kangiella koreensis (strain DSM 16069 / JCM 12317 / KCTC 12182 / SW-125) TaxID=523791 RepID=C7R5X5_KANKD|nr:hypothetical protein [Kangiella koreensis]ACV27299.1 conserved hypothetical protein [Kangiella koreensis DSM 16069]